MMKIKIFQVGLNVAAIMGFFLFAGGEAYARQACSTDADCIDFCVANVTGCCRGAVGHQKYCKCGPRHCPPTQEEKTGQ
ncbi:MAG TPA: hypothetical protein VMW10_06195 [Alphaproteobacteria bacterium]|nr:hypothetical protein [Alphaproteobacteria bacterium]